MNDIKRLKSSQLVQGQQIHLARNWRDVTLLCFILIAGALFIVWSETSSAVIALQEGRSLPEGWTWTRIFVLDAASIFLASAICCFLITQALMVFTVEGVRLPHPFGHIAMRWDEVANVIAHGGSGPYSIIELRSGKHIFRIRGIYFKDRNKLLELIEKQISITR